MNQNPVHQHFFHILLLVVTVALGWILLPFFGAVFWGTILAILFQPLQRWLTIRFGKRRNLAALTTLVLIILIVILPLTVVAGTLVQEISLAYTRIKTDQPNFTAYFRDAFHALPLSVQHLLGRFGLDDIPGIQRRLTEGAAQISQFVATQALSIGQNT
jgi:predicted PurR-regulated permease PerM